MNRQINYYYIVILYCVVNYGNHRSLYTLLLFCNNAVEVARVYYHGQKLYI